MDPRIREDDGAGWMPAFARMTNEEPSFLRRQESIFSSGCFRQRARRTRSSSSNIRQAAPTEIALSAMLKAGKCMPA